MAGNTGGFWNLAAGDILGGAGSLASIGMGVYGMQQNAKEAKRAREAAERRQLLMLDLARRSGQASKGANAAAAEQEMGGAEQSAINRGLYNSSVLDSLKGAVTERQRRADLAVDEGTMRAQMGVLADTQEVGPDPGASMAAGQAVGQGIYGLTSLAPTSRELERRGEIEAIRRDNSDLVKAQIRALNGGAEDGGGAVEGPYGMPRRPARRPVRQRGLEGAAYGGGPYGGRRGEY
ncbi:hypothetical protein [Tolypothrix sp. VBCCA 56010]|uniref:hypothetical protein n=1 Tax=Tolypothrix sp. VBCCA 56010 TaxID=3137731 RepID=UPI003D7D6437